MQNSHELKYIKNWWKHDEEKNNCIFQRMNDSKHRKVNSKQNKTKQAFFLYTKNLENRNIDRTKPF